MQIINCGLKLTDRIRSTLYQQSTSLPPCSRLRCEAQAYVSIYARRQLLYSACLPAAPTLTLSTGVPYASYIHLYQNSEQHSGSSTLSHLKGTSLIGACHRRFAITGGGRGMAGHLTGRYAASAAWISLDYAIIQLTNQPVSKFSLPVASLGG
jgi:hypothetical protein